MLSKARDFIEGNVNYSFKSNLPKHIQEQVELRKSLCSKCLDNNKCVHCGCKTPQMFYSPHKVDSELKWAEFMTQPQWEALVNNYKEYYEYFTILQARDTLINNYTTDTQDINDLSESTNN